VRNTEYRPGRLIAADADLIECFRWLAALPQQPAVPKKFVSAKPEPVQPLPNQ